MPSAREWLDELADERDLEIPTLDGHDADLIGVADLGNVVQAAYDERAVLRTLRSQNPGWTEHDALEWVRVEILPAGRVVLVETPPSTPSIRGALVDRVVKAAQALREHRRQTEVSGREWAASLLSREKGGPMNLTRAIRDGAALAKGLDAAVDALAEYDARTGS